MDRRDVKSSFKRGISVVKRPLPSRSARDIVRRPVSYKPAPDRNAPTRKPEATKVDYRQKTNERKDDKFVGKSNEEAASSKVVEVKQEPPSVEPTAGGHYELSPMLDRMVEEEIQAAMAKVWELQPSNPQDAAEKVVIDKFRHEAGTALRNTLGLNVTKRLLNVHNPLYVKMVFSGKPVRAELISFLNRCNISAFKRVGDRGGTFAARMRSYHDFDRLCTDKQLTCGDIRITVTPCYQFMTCPSNLRTRYNVQKAVESSDVASTKPPQAATSQEISKPAEKVVEKNTTSQQNTASQKNALNQQNMENQKSTSQQNTASQKNTSEQNIASQKNISQQNVASQNKTSQQNTPKVTPTKPNPTTNAMKAIAKTQEMAAEPTKVVPKVPLTKVNNKVTANTNAKVNESQNSPQVTPVKPSSQTQDSAKETNQKTATNATPKANENSVQKVAASKVATPQNSETKVTPVKATQNIQNAPKTVAKVATPTKATTQTQSTSKVLPIKAESTGKVIPKTVSAPTKLATLKTASKVAASKATAKIAVYKPKLAAKAKVSPKKKQSDYDELDDHDILALISEGIVLDECSGSDIE